MRNPGSKNIFLFLFIGLSIFISTSAFATTYYVDATNGLDRNAGTSETTAWKTIAKVNASQFNPGDQILFKMGEVWREGLLVPSSGVAGHSITIGAYGAGEKPVISGSDIFNGWKQVNGYATVYKNTSILMEPKIVFFNGRQLAPTSEATLNLGSNQFKWISGTLYLNVGQDPANGTVEGSQRTGVWIKGKSYIVLENLHFQNCDRGVLIEGKSPTGITVHDCNITKYAHQGIYNNGGDFFEAYNNTIIGGTIGTYFPAAGIRCEGAGQFSVFRNEVSIAFIGIEFPGSWSKGSIYHNHIHDISYHDDPQSVNCQGIELTGTGGNKVSNIDIYGNLVHDTSGACIATWEAENIRIDYNVNYNCSQKKLEDGLGIWSNSNTVKINNNVIYNTGNSGIGASLGCNNIEVKNNIVHTTAAHGINLWGLNNDCDYNIIYNTKLTPWQNIVKGPNSLEADPLFIDPGRGNFALLANSPAIDSGINVGLQVDFNGTALKVGGKEDIGAFQYTKIIAPVKNLKIINGSQ